MRKKRDANDEKENVAEPSGMGSERNGEQVEFEIALDLGPDLDPEGWMAERASYWAKREQPKKLGAAARCVAAVSAIVARWNPLPSARRRARIEQATELTHEDWERLSESALGPLRPVRLGHGNYGSPNGPIGGPAPRAPWKVGELMYPPVEEVPLLSAPGPDEHPGTPIPEAEPDAPPPAAPPRAARRRRP